MNINKIFMFMFLILGLSVGVNAVLNDSVAYYAFDNLTGNLDDSSGNNLNISNNGATIIPGILNDAYDYSSNYLSRTGTNANPLNAIGTSDFSVSKWIYSDATQSSYINYFGLEEAGNEDGIVLRVSSNILIFGVTEDTAGTVQIVGSTLNNSQWYHVVMVRSSGTLNLYLNGQLDGTIGGASGNLDSTNFKNNMYLGVQKVDGGAFQNFFNGRIDEEALYSKALNSSDVTELYNSGIGFNPYDVTTPILTFSNIKANNITLVNNTYYNSDITFETIVLNTSTNSNVNHSYILNGASLVQYATNTLNGSINLNLSDGVYNILFNAFNNETSVNSTNYTFTVDLINPTITNNIPTEINSYDFNGSLFSCTDTNLLTCNISIDGFNKASGVNFTLTHNGNLSYNITAIDLAGNSLTENGVVLVNPQQCNNFYNSTGSAITNYTFGGTLFTNNPACFDTYNDGLVLGSNSLLFEKLGFATTNITFILNSTSLINDSYNITQSKIILSIFDRQTDALLTGTTLITLIAGVGFNGSTTTGLLNISNFNFVSGAYQIIAEHSGYATELITFNYNNQQLLNVDMYLLNDTAITFGTISIKAIADTGELINEATCSVLEWKPSESAYISVGTGVTNINGEINLNIELGVKNYKFTCTKEGVSAVSTPQIIQTTGTILPVILNTAALVPSPFLENIIYSFTNSTENATHQRLTFTWADTDGLVTQGCINVYKVRGTSQTILSSTCVTSATSQIQILIDVNQTYNTVAFAVVTVNSLDTDLKSLIFKGISSISKSLKSNNLALIIPFLFAVLGLVLGFMIKPQNIYMSIIGMFIGIWFGVSIVTDIIPKGTTYFISTMLIIMFWGAYKFK